MPTYEFPITVVTRLLDNERSLAEALLFPELSSYGDRSERLPETLADNATQLLKREEVEVQWRRRAIGPVTESSVTLVVPPPKKGEVWSEPISLTLPIVQWQQAADAWVAYVPAFGIEVLAEAAEDLAERVSKEAVFALLREKSEQSLKRLVELGRCQHLDVTTLTLSAEVDSPKKRAQDDKAESERTPSVLKDVATDLTRQRLEPAFEVDELVERLMRTLTASQPRSVLLVGPSGVGKTAIVRELVRRVSRGQHTPMWSTSGSRLVAGMTGYGMWEERCLNVCREASRQNIVLHLGQLVELMDVGKSVSHAQGVAAFLRPFIARGDLLSIAECTPEQIAVIERHDPHLLGAFVRIDVVEPSPERGRRILESVVLQSTSHRRELPITEAALDQVDRLHRRYATYSAYPGRPLRFLQNLLRDRDPADPPINVSDIVRAFARETGLPEFLLIDSEKSSGSLENLPHEDFRPKTFDPAQLRDWFGSRVIGQTESVDLVVDLLTTVKAGLTRPKRPIASLLFIGPTGVGKTEMAKTLAEFVFGSSERLTRFDMSEYADELAVQRLIGGTFADEGVLTSKIREQPFSVVLLDEFEKAHPLAFDMLLQVLGEGRLTDAGGRLADFTNAVVIMTSNLGAESFQQGAFGFATDAFSRHRARDHFVAEVEKFLRPELFNRIDRVVPFLPLDEATTLRIVRRQLELLLQRDGIKHRAVRLQIDDDVAVVLARRGYDPRYGARPLKRAIERELLAPLADKMNGYSAQMALDADVVVENGSLRVQVRARVDDTGRTVAAGQMHSTDAEAANGCVNLRRQLQGLRRCSVMAEIDNELTRLRRLDEQLRERSYKSPEELTQLAKLTEYELKTRRVEELWLSAVDFEAATLLPFYAHQPLDMAARRVRLRELDSQWQTLWFDIFFDQFEKPDRLVLAVYGEELRRMFRLAEAYFAVLREKRIDIRVWALKAGTDARPSPDDEADAVAKGRLQWRAPKPGAVPPIWQWVWNRPGRPALILLERQLLADPERELAEPAERVIGLLFDLHGRGVRPRFESEAGLHLFRDSKGTKSCLVDTSSEPFERYLPPSGIERRREHSGPRRRLYDERTSVIDDALLSASLTWTQSLKHVLAKAIDQWLAQRAEGMLKT